MPRESIGAYNVQAAVFVLEHFLVDTRSTHKAIYFDGWEGLAASAVLRALAADPPLSLQIKFDRIIHIDCSRWKSRRALQRVIADQLKLPQSVMVAFDREDDEDDYSGVEEDSRSEIEEVGRAILRSLLLNRCLVIFHNGSTDMVDLVDFGIPPPLSGSRLIWTFRGRLRLNPEIKGKVDNSHLYLFESIFRSFDNYTRRLILEEAAEIAKYTEYKNYYMTPEIATKCVSYLLWLNKKGGNTMDYNWAIHASNYWLCDGIIGHEHLNDEIWEHFAAFHKQIHTEECSSHSINFPDDYYREQWMSVIYTSDNKEMEDTTLPSKLTSFFMANKNGVCKALPQEMFQQLKILHVLKLSWCSFSFCSPPFQCCRSLRFLGLHHCKDQRREEDDKQGRPIMELFQSLWVLDISQTDWEFDLSQDLAEQMASNIREVHIKKGRIWHSKIAWRQLQNLRKLRVIQPTSSWETSKKDEFTGMPKLELLDLSGNSTIQVLPSLSSASGLRTLVLDGCVGLDHVGPEGLPPALETFSLDASSDKLLQISLSGCTHLQSFMLRGKLPRLEELNLSGTSVRRVDLSNKVVQVDGLKKVFLMGCKQLRAVLWWEETRQLDVLCIDTLETEYTRPHYFASDPHIQHRNYVVTADVRIIQSLVIRRGIYEWDLITRSLYLDLHKPPAGSTSKSKEPIKDKVMPKPCCYSDVILLEGVSASSDNNETMMKWPPPLDRHMEVGEGISLTDVESDKGIGDIQYVMLKRINSLHVHDNSCILDVTPKYPPSEGYQFFNGLEWCRVESCPKLRAVFSSHDISVSYAFPNLKTIWVSDLSAAACIWSQRSIYYAYAYGSCFDALVSIYLHKCPRLKFAIPLSESDHAYFPSLETLHITQCCDLRQVFPRDNVFSKQKTVGDDVHLPQQYREARAVKQFPNLKHILLHDLFSLQEICYAKMVAPILESVRIKGCWGLRRLPTIGHRNNSSRRPVVHCQKDLWMKLEWDGLHAGHDPSLYEPHYSAYYKKRLLRGKILR